MSSRVGGLGELAHTAQDARQADYEELPEPAPVQSLSAAPPNGRARFPRPSSAANPAWAVADCLERRTPELVAAVRDAVREDLPELHDLDDPEVSALCRRALATNLEAGVAHLRTHDPRPGALPLDVVRLARLWARRGMPVELLMRGYIVGQQVALDMIVDTVAETDMPADLRQEATAKATRAVLGYSQAVLLQSVLAHDDERDRQNTSPQLRRLHLVEGALAGHDGGLALGYDLRMNHLAVLARGDDPVATVEALRAHTRRRMLVVQPDAEHAWAWIGGFDEFARNELKALAQHAADLGGPVAFGTARPGLAGFKTTFDQARLAHGLGVRADQTVTLYANVALEALAVADEPQARMFVLDELGPLLVGDIKSASLLGTLRAYFAAAGNAASCAAALDIHVQTVAYRLRRVEDRLGHPIQARRAELELALRLELVLT